MPGMTGFDVISAIADIHRPHIVFVTAYDTFALRAFEVHALDYLLKPVNEERFDAAIDYKAPAGDIDERLKAVCSEGVDCFFDNSSGPVHDVVLRHINIHARIAICGTVAYSSWKPWHDGPRPERHLLLKRALVRGFTGPFKESRS